MTQSTLEQRVQRLEDVEAIRGLTMQLARHFDDDYDADAIVGLFTDEAFLDLADFGQYHGRDEIHAFYSGISEQITFSKHHIATHTIDVDPSGSRATGVFYMLATITMGGTAMYLANTWNNRYQKLDGRWLITNFGLEIQFLTPYDSGWAKVPMAT